MERRDMEEEERASPSDAAFYARVSIAPRKKVYYNRIRKKPRILSARNA
jgi:hypothetical protein